MKTIRQKITNDILVEKLCKSSDKYYIQKCQKALEDLNTLDFKRFINSGHIMPVKHLRERYPKRQLREDTKSVCRYIGGFCIEFVGDNKFFWNYHEDKDIKHVEHTLFNHIKELINEQER
jgi:hypothetical protein|tara:strand:+ start:974 stop:1333 length:360 start_codon:yes stop_codon:yes gene_type:complete